MKIIITNEKTTTGWSVVRTDGGSGENTPIKTKEELIYYVNEILFDHLKGVERG